MFIMAQATDELDIHLFSSLFIPGQTATIDVSKHLGLAPQDVLPENLAEQMLGVLRGFTATHHLITNPVITIDPSTPTKAKATAYKTAYHCIQDDNSEIQSATARGTWDMELEQFQGRWVIRRFTVVRTVPLHPRELALWGAAKDRVADGKGRPVKSI